MSAHNEIHRAADKEKHRDQPNSGENFINHERSGLDRGNWSSRLAYRLRVLATDNSRSLLLSWYTHVIILELQKKAWGTTRINGSIWLPYPYLLMGKLNCPMTDGSRVARIHTYIPPMLAHLGFGPSVPWPSRARLRSLSQCSWLDLAWSGSDWFDHCPYARYK